MRLSQKLMTGLCAGALTLGVAGVGTAQAEPIPAADPIDYSFQTLDLDYARSNARNVVLGLQHLSKQDKDYYCSAIDIAPDGGAINNYVTQAINDNNYYAAHPGAR